MGELSVLSVNGGVLGHATHQRSLERGFPRHVPDVAFHSVLLSERNKGDWFGRIVYAGLTRRLPWRRDIDWDWYRLRSELGASLFLRRYLRDALPRLKPDVLHIHTQSIGLLARDILLRTPCVVSLDCTSALVARIHPWPAAHTYKPIIDLERRCFLAARHIVCWSETVRRSVVADYGVDSRYTSVIRPSVERRAWSDQPEDGGIGHKLRLLFVGNDFRRKGGHDLVEIFVGGLQGTCELDVVSNGIASLPAVSGLRLHRGLTAGSAKLQELYASADVFVMPTYEDAFGIVYIEAMAAGLPCIGSDVLAVPELVEDGVTGLVVRPGDRRALLSAIQRLRDDAPFRSRLRQQAVTFVERECDDAKNCRKLADVYWASADRPNTTVAAARPAAA